MTRINSISPLWNQCYKSFLPLPWHRRYVEKKLNSFHHLIPDNSPILLEKHRRKTIWFRCLIFYYTLESFLNFWKNIGEKLSSSGTLSSTILQRASWTSCTETCMTKDMFSPFETNSFGGGQKDTNPPPRSTVNLNLKKTLNHLPNHSLIIS